MSHSKTYLYYHCVIVVKARDNVLYPKLRNELILFIKSKIKTFSKSQAIVINGHFDHLHLLVSLHPIISVSYFMKVIKGSSSRFINSIGVLDELHFQWSEGYFAETVHKKDLARLKEYINNQSEHHSNYWIENEF